MSREKKFTEGPWKFIERPNLDRLIVDKHGYPTCFISRLAGPVNVQKANANLVSAATELLEELEIAREIIITLSEFARGGIDGDIILAALDSIRNSDAAIDKAYGES